MKIKFTYIILFFILGIQVLKAQIHEIPFQLKNDIILIEVNINDNTQNHTFVFDTGASYDVLDTEVAKSLGLKPDYKQEASGAGGITSVDIVLNQKLNLGNTISLDISNLILVDLTRLKNKLERNFDGIIGYSLLRNYITKIDYDYKLIQFFEKLNEVKTEGYSRIPFQFKGGIPIPQFDISLTLNNNENYTGTIFFDSGAALTLSINTPYNKRYKLNEKVERSIISETENLSSKSISEDIAIKSLDIGAFTLEDMVISLANDKEGVSSYKDYLGILGAKVISRFNIILDYTDYNIYLKPNDNFSKKFEFPLSGIKLKKEDGVIVIGRVQKNSMAYDKGVLKGDKLISVNDITTDDIEKYRELLKQEGQSCKLVLIDGEGKRKEVNIELKRLL
ncbi:aspartyl protease family protein [Winogradskyella aquimaris]|uniref:Aspartyl protease family protein n=1 Tax=Winogradskyella aquimaris TaxID=864074 RepID=A0ABU5EN20_9FLAO|nr:aspartyl protease family protein [Winogradskyella aquimaris]MDY2587145.1 aspartyl protease family protein [Winogradskyella aquimaris]